MKITAASALPLAFAALGGSAYAQSLDISTAHLARPLALTTAKDSARPPAITLIPAGSPLAQDIARREAGLARTGVDKRLDEETIGSLGFLCGRQPGPDLAGSAAAFGSDPHGRFLGAKVSYSF